MKELKEFAVKTRLDQSIINVGWGNGYVALPEGHPCFGMDYDEIHEKYNIQIHGGLTYADMDNDYFPDEFKGMWVVGFDTAHAGDSLSNWPDEQTVMEEAKRLKEQLEVIK